VPWRVSILSSLDHLTPVTPSRVTQRKDDMKRFPYAPEPKLTRKDTRAQLRRALHFALRCGLDGMEVPDRTLENHVARKDRGPGAWACHHLFAIKRDYFNGGPGKGSCRLLVMRPEGRKHVRTRLKEVEAAIKEKRSRGGGEGLVLSHSRARTSSAATQERLCLNIGNGDWRRQLDVPLRLCLNTSPSRGAGLAEWLMEAGWLSPRSRSQVALELDTLHFAYRERKDGRLHHPLQWVRSDFANRLWEEVGLKWDYDISACHPTLLYQAALKVGSSPFILAPVKDFLDRKDVYRQLASDLLGCPFDEAKQVVTSLFLNSTISTSPRCKLYVRFACKAIAFRRHPLIDALIKSIQRGIWAHLSIRHGDMRSAKKKARLARSMERRVINAASSWMNEQGIKHFIIHDGWRADRDLDVAGLGQRVKEATGFEVTIERKT